MTNLKGQCPICEAKINIPADTEESEILTCSDCANRVVVEKLTEKNVELAEAPEIEEDWGE